MRKILIILSLALLFPSIVIAQQQSESNEVRTRVGNPTTNASDCPVPGGPLSCGSRNHPRGGCAHGSASYCSAYGGCYESLAYALDIGGAEGDPVYLPTIYGDVITWAWLSETPNDSRTSYIAYAGTNPETGEQYKIRFHHSLPGSGGGTKQSGDIAVNMCIEPCSNGSGPHTHIEFWRINSNGSETPLEAPLYFCVG